MNDRLIDMLKQADAAFSRGDETDGVLIADQIVARSVILNRDRRRRRIGICAFAAIGVIGAGYLTLPSMPARNRISVVVHEIETVAPIAPQTAEAVAAEIEQLRFDSRLILERLDQSGRRADRRTRWNGPTVKTTRADSQLRAAIAAETAGQAMLLRGDLLRDSALTRQMASAAYERVISLFPNSAAASDARTRLASLASNKGDTI